MADRLNVAHAHAKPSTRDLTHKDAEIELAWSVAAASIVDHATEMANLTGCCFYATCNPAF